MQFSPAMMAQAIHPVVLLSLTECTHIHIRIQKEDLCHNRQKIGSSLPEAGSPLGPEAAGVCVCLCGYLSVLSVCKLMVSVAP